MNISYKWLQSYFEEPLPEVEKLAEILTMGAFEIEGVEEVGDDWMIDVDVLPNRTHDCLGHRGIAKEIAVLLAGKGLTLRSDGAERSYGKRLNLEEQVKSTLGVLVEEPSLCRRYVGRKINNIKVGPSPDWLKERLEAIGQKSINNIVDATNYVMFDLGQPLHAFDADKLCKHDTNIRMHANDTNNMNTTTEIVVRKAKGGEKIITLDEKEVELNDKILVIADNKDPLAVAGIKGGKKAEVNENTTNLVLEAANFEPSNIRKTTRLVNIQTDSSKRFENEITPELAGIVMEELTALILEVAGTDNTEVEEVADVDNSCKWKYKVGVSTKEVNDILGTNLSDTDIENILNRFDFGWEKVNPREKVIEIAEKVLGSEYKRPSSMRHDAPDAFSCTSLISYVFVQAGIYMPSMAVDKYVYGTPVSKEELQAGDVIFVNTEEGTGGKAPKIFYETIEYRTGTKVIEGVDHSGIYMGDNKVLHTTWKFGKAVIEDLNSAEQFKNIIGYRSFIFDEDRYVITIPDVRLDLRIKEDLIEEIGRVYGYANIESVPLDIKTDRVVNKRLHYMNRIREVLQNAGYSENYGYTFRSKGEIEMEKSLAQGKDFLRTNLTDGMNEALEFNDRYKDLLAIDRVRMFEFGSVFTKEKEWMSFAIGLGQSKQKGEEDVCELLNKELSIDLKADIFGKQGGVFEVDFDALVEILPEPSENKATKQISEQQISFSKISPYPFITRDIAVWTSSETQADDVLELIRKEAGDLLVQNRLFDVYEKDVKISYAFNLVFQSQDKTLTDEEINEIMEKITMEMEKNGWEVR